MKVSKFLLSVLLLLCHSLNVLSAPLQDYFLEQWDTSDGLPHNSINGLVQTGDGYLWFATWEGLARYNGREFDLFGRGELTGLPSSAIRSVVADGDGGMLVISDRGGISRYYQNNWVAYPRAPGRIKHLLRSHNGDLWLAVEGNGVFRRSATQLEQPGTDQLIIPKITGNRLAQDNLGRIWVASDQGVFLIEGDSVRHLGTKDGLPEVTAYEVLWTADQRLLVGTAHGAWRLDGEQFQAVHADLKEEAITSMLVDQVGDVWMGTIKSGLYRLRDIGLEYLGADDGLPENRVMSMIQDREQSIWLGTNGGLIRLRDAPFTTWTEKRGLNGDYVRTVLSHSDGSMWVGGSRGLSRIEAGRSIALDAPTFQPAPSVLSLAEGPDGSVWVGTYASGLLRWHQGQLETVASVDSGLSSNEIRSLQFDDQGELWIGTSVGINIRSADGSIRHLGVAQGLSDDFVITLAKDTNGTIWAGTALSITAYRNSTFQNLMLAGFDGASHVFGLTFDGDYLWAMTSRGLIRYRRSDQQVRLISSDDGLPFDTFFQAIKDRLGGLWLTSSRGVVRVDLADLHALADGVISTLPFELYGEGDGLVTAQANGVSNPAATLDKRGQLWVATAKGVARVNPHNLLQADASRFPVAVESIVIGDQPVKEREDVVLPAGTSRLSVHYAGLGYIGSKHIRYRTLLEGFDKDWIERGDQRVAEYTNLPPGRYRLRIQAAYPRNDWGQNERTVSVVQEAFFWQQGWFQVLAIFTAIALLALLSKWRVYQLQRNEARLMALVKEQTLALRLQADLFEKQAREDRLTGLPNRRAFDEWLADGFRAMEQHQTRLVLAIVDIDHFKRINDRWSHLVGDEAICSIARVLERKIPSCCRVARWGGEEFTLLFSGVDIEDALQYCEQLRKDIEESRHETSAGALTLTASFGVASSNDVVSYERMLVQADVALYQAKNNGRNRVEIWQKQEVVEA